MKNRVIKFRAWDNGEMFYQSDKDEFTIYNIEKLFSKISGVAILMQFTGLTDKNGVEIFEGDVIPCKVGIQQYSNWVVGDEDASLNGAVEWNEHQLCWQIRFKQPNKYGIISSQFGWGSSPVLEVIGNIYQTAHSEIGKDGGR